MADTDFAALPATSTIAGTDQLLVVRNGAAYRFSGLLPAIDAAGAIAATGATLSPSGATSSTVYPLNLYGNVGGAATMRLRFGSAANGYGTHSYIEAQTLTGTASDLRFGVSGMEAARFDNAGNLRPGADNGRSLGLASFRWSTVYAATGSINTSDERAKQQIGAVPDDWLDAWADVEWVRYRFNDAVTAKGDEARWHVGLIAQQVRDAFAARGLDAMTIGLLCHDEWKATPEVPAVEEERDADGEIVTPAQAAIPARPAGDRYGLRYDECQAIEAAYQRRQIARLTARLDALETA